MNRHYHWMNLQMKSEPPIRRCVLVDEWSGCRVSTLEERPDGWWRVLTHNRLEGHEYMNKAMAQRAIQQLYDIEDGEVEEW